MRRAARTDENHSSIRLLFRQLGCTVEDLAGVGKGVPDLLIGYQGKNYLVEVKDGNKPPSARTLTADQQKWHRKWTGQVVVVSNADEVLEFINTVRVAA